YRFDILARFRNKFLDLFILVMGIVAISAAIHDLL
ncbi:hypothetical protein OLT34_04520, partial [Campylobacter jejuni]|nr:hypothetical protein [Campylobacter jejuni]